MGLLVSFLFLTDGFSLSLSLSPAHSPGAPTHGWQEQVSSFWLFPLSWPSSPAFWPGRGPWDGVGSAVRGEEIDTEMFLGLPFKAT